MKNSIKGLLSFLFLFVVLVGTFTACKSTNVPVPTNTETTKEVNTKVVLRDTIFKTKQDSSYYKAWLECQNNKVVIKTKSEAQRGNYLKEPKVIIKDNYLTVDCEAEAQKLFAQWKDVYTLENQSKTITITVPVERQLTWWQKFQIWCGRIFLIIGLVSVIKFLLKFYKPI
ncbi:hypothetical protein [Flavobacterium sp.]|uniref:hypothetical protein n=1 Tax=Flavobacterium sp. TaxID=239 RepID=UPI0037534DBB